MLKQIQKACLRVGVKTTNDATFPSLYSGYKELPNCSFQILPTQLQKCQKTGVGTTIDTRMSISNSVKIQINRKIANFK